MSTPPRRLKDDPDFLWETGCDLADEAFVVGGHDLPALRARVLAATQPPSGGAPLKVVRSGSVVAKVGSVLALLALVGAGLWVGLPGDVGVQDLPAAVPPGTSATDARVTPAAPERRPGVAVDYASRGESQRVGAPGGPTDAAAAGGAPSPAEGPAEPASRREPVAAPPAAVAPPPPADRDAAGPSAAPEASSERVSRSQDPAAHGVDEAPLADAGAQRDAAGRPGDDGEVRTSTLAAEVALYDAAADLLVAGDASGAADGYGEYLDRYPEGRLVIESRLGLLRAEVARGPSDAVEELTKALLADPRLSGKRAELGRIRADNLVLLDRCSEALDAAESLPSRDAAQVRRACRWKP